MAEISISQFSNEAQEVLTSLEATQHEFWNIDRETANYLHNFILENNIQNAIEIGTSNGYSGIWQASAVKKNGGKFSTIEFWDKRQSVAIQNFKICDCNDVITTYLGSAFPILEEINVKVNNNELEKFDYAFIDANKKEYIEYFKLLDPILKSGAYIFADNMLSHKEKVQPFLDAISSNENYEIVLMEMGTGVLKAKKKN